MKRDSFIFRIRLGWSVTWFSLPCFYSRTGVTEMQKPKRNGPRRKKAEQNRQSYRDTHTQGRQPRKVSIYAARRGRGTARYYLPAQFVAFTSRIPPYLIRPRGLCRSFLQAMENTLLFSCEGKQPFLRFGRLETVSSTCRIRCFANLSAKEVRVRVTHQRQSKSVVDIPFHSTTYFPRQEKQKKYGSSCSSMQLLLLLSIFFVLHLTFTSFSYFLFFRPRRTTEQL